MSGSLRYGKAAEYLVYRPAFWLGYGIHGVTGWTPWASYFAFRQLHCTSAGQLNQSLSTDIGKRRPALRSNSEQGLLAANGRANEVLGAALDELRRDGCHSLEPRLDDERVEELRHFALHEPGRWRLENGETSEPAIFTPDSAPSPRFDFSEDQLIRIPAVHRLLADQSLVDLARDYLGCEPINDLVAMWWSCPHGAVASSSAAQLFHFDMDRVYFLKFFFYLSDVEDDTGPHEYVRGSHRKKRREFLQDRRYSDKEIDAEYGADSRHRFVGPRGTVLCADTSGFHKGNRLERGTRLLLQIEFTNCLFGQAVSRPGVPEDADPVLLDAMKRSPAVYQRFRLG